MGRSKESFYKREKEKKRLQQKQQKREKMEERKSNAAKGKSLDEMMAYIDEEGNLTTVPPDGAKTEAPKQTDSNNKAADSGSQ